jgi:PadR family transcriptional regulator PadR
MISNVGAQLRKGVVESCVLGLLEKKPMYGWQLSEILISSGMIASVGTLYPMLTRMRSHGLIVSYEEASPSGPVRKFYRLTDPGIVALLEFRNQWTPFVEVVDRLIAERADHD